MSKENITLIYSVIIRAKHTILSEYTEFSGNFSQIIIEIMKEIIMKFEDIPNICRGYFFYGKYALFFLKYNKVYIITMLPNVKLNNKEIIFAFLYSIFDEMKSKKEIDIEKMDKMKAYSLIEFSKIFEDKIKLFNSNFNTFINYIKNLKDFQIYEIKERNFESNIQLPVLSKKQTHTEKTEKEETDFDNTDNNSNSMNKSFNSYMTYDSFKDDFLDKNVISNNEYDNNEEQKENLLKEIEINEINKTSEINKNSELSNNINLNDTNESMNNNIDIQNNIKCCICSKKTLIIIIVISILIIASITLIIVFAR
jgi:hypothetical protein